MPPVNIPDNQETSDEKESRLNNISVWEYKEGTPRPIWTDNAFAGEFGDNFIQDTSLEGGHIPEAIERLQSCIKSSWKQLEKGVLKGFNSREKKVILKALDKMKSAGNVGRRLRSPSFTQFIFDRIEQAKKLPVGDLMVWPGGWSKPGGGHAIMYVIEKTNKNTISWITCNTGEGIQHHPTTMKFFPKQKRKLAIRIDNIPIERLANQAYLYLLFRMQKFEHKDHGDGLYYNVVLPFLIGKSRALSAAWNHDDQYGQWETPQKAGTCFFRCVLCTLKYLLRRSGLDKSRIKVFFHAVRQSFLLQAIADLKNVAFVRKPLHHSQVKLIQLASKQTAYSAVKEGKAGRLDTDTLKTVKAMCEEIESLLDKSGRIVPPVAELPLLSYEKESNPIKFEPWRDGLLASFTRAYEGNTDSLKGDADRSRNAKIC